MTQHDDHIWLTVLGEAWAIRHIYRRPEDRSVIIAFDLWRGYYPYIETRRITVIEADWPRYCRAAVDVIEAQLRPLV